MTTTRTSTPGRPPAVVTGMMFFRPVAGVVYQVLHYMLALQRLGFAPVYVERTGWWMLDPITGDVSPDPSGSIRAVRKALAPFGLEDAWALRFLDGTAVRAFGIDDRRLVELCAAAPVLLNVTGTQWLSDEMLTCGKKLYIESDPFTAQFDVAMGDEGICAHLDAHDLLFSFGETLSSPEFPLPLGRYEWRATRQPVDLAVWHTDGPPRSTRFTTVTSWHNDDKDRVWDGVVYYWTKGREFRKYADVAQRWPGRFEMAVTSTPESRQALGCSWTTVDAHAISADMARYTRYVQDSFAEFTVARDQYVRPRTGWFSDRSACYLAAGRPVVTQETGFSSVLPTGKGLFAFSTADEIDAAVEEILRDPPGNQAAAREIAAEYFDGDRLVRSMLEQAAVL
jgi:hypothetical protein